ncbi:MAG TPA: spore germination protein GerW family protein [Candidatus Limnocylindria bacterium]|nr:spore germination protein GerW family protein [Candidatus Limnocylindria bacterium]
MNVQQGLTQAQDAMSVRRVFGEPYEKDGATVIPAARIRGGGGGGQGRQPGQEQGEGSGYGFGLVADPTGAFVIKEGKVNWVPAIDVNRVILGGQIIAVVALLVLRSILRSK